MRVMSAGDGYRYMLRSVAAGDGDRSLSTPLTRYYAEAGTPPGRWIGAGFPHLADGTLHAGDVVTEEQLAFLIGEGRDPITGEALGRAYREFATSDRRAVAGFDFTFSIPKSASVLWAVSDATTQRVIVDAHHAAVADVLAFMEREVAATRMGVSDGSGSVAQMDVTGFIAAGFDHFDSRAGDPHLHTHVVIANKAMTVIDGKWRSLDGRPLHSATVALSELHEAAFADRLTRALGVDWEPRAQGRDRNASWSIKQVPEQLSAAFSSRSRQIDVATDELIAHYRARHGHRPGKAAIVKLRAQATLSTRPEKQVKPLSELTSGWCRRATSLLGEDATAWASTVIDRQAPAVLRADDVTGEVAADLAGRVVAVVGERRSTWRRWNLMAEAARQTMGWRFDTVQDREAVLTQITDAAERGSVRLTPPELASSPEIFRREDGSSRFRPRHSTKYSSTTVLEAEDRLLALGRDHTGPALAPARPSAPMRAARHAHRLSPDQVVAVKRSRPRAELSMCSWGRRGLGRRPRCAPSAIGGKLNTAAAPSSASPPQRPPRKFSGLNCRSPRRTRPNGCTSMTPGAPPFGQGSS